jgi:cation transporter-like permease
VDPEFQKALLITGAAGTFIIAVGAVTLYFVFRRFGEAKAGGRAHMVLIASLVAFVLGACVVLFALSYSRW